MVVLELKVVQRVHCAYNAAQYNAKFKQRHPIGSYCQALREQRGDSPVKESWLIPLIGETSIIVLLVILFQVFKASTEADLPPGPRPLLMDEDPTKYLLHQWPPMTFASLSLGRRWPQNQGWGLKVPGPKCAAAPAVAARCPPRPAARAGALTLTLWGSSIDPPRPLPSRAIQQKPLYLLCHGFDCFRLLECFLSRRCCSLPNLDLAIQNPKN
jgi:hypothetical protein